MRAISWQVLNNALHGRIKWLLERLWYDILTDIEELRLEEWLLESAKNDDAAKERLRNFLGGRQGLPADGIFNCTITSTV